MSRYLHPSRWKEHDTYSKALERLLRDLKVEASLATDGYAT